MADAPIKASEPSTFEKAAAIAGGAVLFTGVAFFTKRLLKRAFPEPEQVLVLIPRQGALPDGEGDEEDEE